MNYVENAQKFAQSVGLTMKIDSVRYGSMSNWEDDTKRYIFKITLKRKGKQYTFYFGQSVFNGSQEPTIYDVLTCLQKYDVGDFSDFCNDFGYTYESKEQRKRVYDIYKAVCKEYKGVERLFGDVMEELQEIQ